MSEARMDFDVVFPDGGDMKFFDCITDFIFVEHTPERADIIFVPGGNYPEAAKRAAALYREGYAPCVMPSGRHSITKGRFERPGFSSECAYLSSILREEGVPKDAILQEDQATYTYENAIFSKRKLKELGIPVRKALICCQAFHARRSLMYYQEQFPEVDFVVCPVVTRGISRNSWYCTDAGIDTVLGELERCGGQFHEIMRQWKEEKGREEQV